MHRFVVRWALLALLLALPAPAAAADLRPWTVQHALSAGEAPPAGLRAALRDLGVPARRFDALPMLVVRATPAQARRIARRPDVLAVRRVGRRVRLHLDRTVPMVFGGSGLGDARAAGLDGRGERIAVIDSGADGTHPDLLDRISHNVELLDGAAVECPGPCTTDTLGHGSHVTGVAVGTGLASDGRHAGVAPAAQVVSLSVTNTDTAADFRVLEAIDWLLARPELGVVAVNASFGLDDPRFDPLSPLNQATKLLHDAGMTVVFSAGNNGFGSPRDGAPVGSSDCETGGSACAMNTNAVAPWVLAVGASRAIRGGETDPSQVHLADFSSRGDPEPQEVDGLRIDYRPDLVAPGSQVLAATSTSLTGVAPRCQGVSRCFLDRDPATIPFYTSMAGTSFAAPHVTGAVAVLQGAARRELGRRLSPAEVHEVLQAGAVPMRQTDTHQDFCGTPPVPGAEEPCGTVDPGFTGAPYEAWQVGAGLLSVPGALQALRALPR